MFCLIIVLISWMGKLRHRNARELCSRIQTQAVWLQSCVFIMMLHPLPTSAFTGHPDHQLGVT